MNALPQFGREQLARTTFYIYYYNPLKNAVNFQGLGTDKIN